MKRFLRSMLAACLTGLMLVLPGGSLSEEPGVEDRGVDLTEQVSVRYPAVTGMEDEALQGEINGRIQEDCRIREYLERATALISGGKLRTGWEGGITGEIFSCALWAEGAVQTSRTSFVWTASTVDLRDGHAVTPGELFTDEAEAGSLMTDYLEETIAPEMSAHLANSQVTPLPELFTLDSAGLTLLYPAEQLSTLSDRAGAVRIGWNVLRPVLNLEEDSVLARMGAGEMISLTAESAEKLLAGAAEGRLPGIPASLGDSLQELTDRYRLLSDPDGYENGRMFSLEGSAFGGVSLLTDDLSRDWVSSRVEGIRMDRGCAWGLCVGETPRAEWLDVLGEPEGTAEIGEEKAEANRIVPGNCDYYRCGEYQLRLYSDADGILVCVVLAE